VTASTPAGHGSAGSVSSLRLPADAAAVSWARGWAPQLCQQWNAGDVCDDAALLLSELVSNSILHAGTELLVELSNADNTILIAVTDGSTRPARLRPSAPLAEAGRGLMLVDALSTRWGVTAWPTGKRVWAELHSDRA
jgi:anti-sigma regulatory factor (Ser/Thr protein kinase)